MRTPRLHAYFHDTRVSMFSVGLDVPAANCDADVDELEKPLG